MRIIVIDGFHKGHVVDLSNPAPPIKLIKPKTITICDCDEPGSMQGEHFNFDSSEISYRCAFKSIDGNVALYSQSGESAAIFDSGFAHVWREKPWGRDEVLYFGCHDFHAWQTE